MFIKKLKIENFKGYHGEDNELEFNIPDGETEGSGLNIFVGENNAGKSTVFEVIDFIKDGTKKNIEDLICKSDPDNIAEKLSAELKWFTEFGHLNRGDMLTSEQHRCHNEKKKFQRRV